MLLFFKIGFLFKKELDLESRLLLAGDVEGKCRDFSEPVCKGPYNQVTSQSLSLVMVVNYMSHSTRSRCALLTN